MYLKLDWDDAMKIQDKTVDPRIYKKYNLSKEDMIKLKEKMRKGDFDIQ